MHVAAMMARLLLAGLSLDMSARIARPLCEGRRTIEIAEGISVQVTRRQPKVWQGKWWVDRPGIVVIES